jgi:hypothetical protein
LKRNGKIVALAQGKRLIIGLRTRRGCERPHKHRAANSA